ncbi:class I SAM-dependent DNA methyltransferase [Planktothricoides raciborskii]|uniref:site-specific DNA-methyltransferase (adenine-specific) n=1 Tax=Planktothricoides raciborskii FACHB-1370 TaxID=2949576 RepID=A0ABR8E827_9CYAN|nr:DNA methyltransferase [Planktothricoides raciborskii]MBD2542891.1 class I SAM-dependent DNA methyltransferase [Planktothricoides raciborskii FACHB-1370]MBD2581362.1 class I SAM-dependent DNA methyltransferase [Planktothricoides raciborskii FACHB-1261]
MNEADKQRVQAFLNKWQGSEGNERANYQSFFGDLCVALGVAGPPPKGSVSGDPYCFDKDIKFYSEKGESTRFADFYKQGHFLIEAKQGSKESTKGHGKRGTKAYQDAMQKAFYQAKSYANNRMLGELPPFLITCDIGSHFEIWQGFSGEYGSYGARQQVNLADLIQPEVFDRFVKIFTDPQELNPEKYRARVTREVAAELAKLSRWLEEQGHEPQETANFLMRCIFTMFAEDVKLLPGEVFTKALRDRWISSPKHFKPEIESLWQTMNIGGKFGFEKILRFNGSFFQDATAFALPKDQLEVLYAAAAKDWSQVEPAIFGTLLERALEKKERSRLGAHYTPRSYVERLVRPVVMEPLRQEWDEIELEVKRLLEPEPGKEEPTKNQRNKAEKEIRGFLAKLRTIKILDPACGTGNFLYVTFDLMKSLEDEVFQRLEDVTNQSRDQLMLDIQQVQINPSQFLGIEINPRAAAIAELVIWIGYLQWQFRQRKDTGFLEPVLQAFGNIECRDAVLAYDGKKEDIDPKTGKVRTRWGGKMMTHPVTGEEVPDPTDQIPIYRYINPRPAEWPEADYVVSNPPFVGDKRMKNTLGDDYVKSLRQAHHTVPGTCDLVMFWWNQAGELLSKSKIKAFGLITTNTITQVFNRKIIEKYLEKISLSFAIPDHPWVDGSDVAAVRIAMTVAVPGQSKGVLCQVVSEYETEEGYSVPVLSTLKGIIRSNLSIGADILGTHPLLSNLEMGYKGVTVLGEGFFLSEKEFTELLQKENKAIQVIKILYKGKDITNYPRNLRVIDLYDLSEEQVRSSYPNIYQWIKERVFPVRAVQKRKSYRDYWWIFAEPRPQMRVALKGIDRYIATVETAKHRVFVFLRTSEVLPDVKLVLFASNDAYLLGVLSSKVHITWALPTGGTLEDRPVYSKTRCFDPFPFPDPTPEQKQKIRELGERLDAHRKQVQANHPDITITGMYNLLEKLRAGEPFTDQDREYNSKALVSTLKQIHDDLDRAVFAAYGWDDLIPLWEQSQNHNPKEELENQILDRLVALNAERAEEERNGLIRWLRPEYQAPEAQAHQTTLEGVTPEAETVVEPVEQQKWPTKPKEQLAAIRDLLRTNSHEWTVNQIAAQFTGRNTQKKLDAITENLERLEWFGMIISHTKNGITSWQYTELPQAG